MERFTKGILKMGKSMDLEYTNGRTNHLLKDGTVRTGNKDMVNFEVRTTRYSRVNGRTASVKEGGC